MSEYAMDVITVIASHKTGVSPDKMTASFT